MTARPITIYVMQSAHTDIGYTHPQPLIADMYLDHYDYMLDLCRRTADDPVDHRFKWTCETFWQVETYLTHRPERTDEFIHYARAGQIEVTAGYYHFTDLVDSDAYRRSVQKAVDFCAKHDLPLRCVLHCDINGWPWSVADILSEFGIPYFCSQVHIDSATDPLGERGSGHYLWVLENPAVRPDIPTRVPKGFWWQGPRGGKVLHWLNEHYLLGNGLGLSSPYGFPADKTRYFYEADRLSGDEVYAAAQQVLPGYIDRMQAAGYPYPAMMISTGGYYIDNSRPDDRWCHVIARWNAENVDSTGIQLRTTTLGEWFDQVEAFGTSELPTYRTAWPDHWAHGLGSATARMAQARRSQRRRGSVYPIVGQSGSKVAQRWADHSLNQELAALEHTFCAWSTTAHPDSAMNDFQHIIKDAYFHQAEMGLIQAAALAVRALLPAPGPDEAPRLCVAAPAHAEAAMRLVYFDAGDTKLTAATHQLLDITNPGQPYPIQVDNTDAGEFVALLPTSPAALTTYQLTPREPRALVESYPAERLATEAWQIRVDPSTGALYSLIEAATGREWVDQGASSGFGQLVHETVIHPLGRDAVGNRARLIQLDMATEEARAAFEPGPIVRHETLIVTSPPHVIPGPLFDALIIPAQSRSIGSVLIQWRCYHSIPMVELVLDWRKVWSDLPEAAYVVFPFAGPGATLDLETAGGFFTPGSHGDGGQLPGTCSSYYTVQRGARIRSGQSALYWLTPDAPLVMTNAVDYNRWETAPYQWNGLLASMPVNHYWHTNFPISQDGAIRLRYRLVCGAGFASEENALHAAEPLDALGWR